MIIDGTFTKKTNVNSSRTSSLRRAELNFAEICGVFGNVFAGESSLDMTNIKLRRGRRMCEFNFHYCLISLVDDETASSTFQRYASSETTRMSTSTRQCVEDTMSRLFFFFQLTSKRGLIRNDG